MFLDDVSDQGFDALDMSGENGTVQPEYVVVLTGVADIFFDTCHLW